MHIKTVKIKKKKYVLDLIIILLTVKKKTKMVKEKDINF
jgi:hypothetical protein